MLEKNIPTRNNASLIFKVCDNHDTCSIVYLHFKYPAAFTNHLILRCTSSENKGMKYINLQLRI